MNRLLHVCTHGCVISVNPLINTLVQTLRTTRNFLITQLDRFLGTSSCTLIMLHQLCSPRVPAWKCSSISTRHLAMSQVCSKAMFLTDKNFVVCMHQSLIFYSNFYFNGNL
jgi:hypothetical protein